MKQSSPVSVSQYRAAKIANNVGRTRRKLAAITEKQGFVFRMLAIGAAIAKQGNNDRMEEERHFVTINRHSQAPGLRGPIQGESGNGSMRQ